MRVATAKRQHPIQATDQCGGRTGQVNRLIGEREERSPINPHGRMTMLVVKPDNQVTMSELQATERWLISTLDSFHCSCECCQREGNAYAGMLTHVRNEIRVRKLEPLIFLEPVKKS